MKRFLPMLLSLMLAFGVHGRAHANPEGGVVQFGDAAIAGMGTGHVQIHQASPKAVLQWQKFNIQPGETTTFHQPSTSSVAINKILDGQASQILGSLNANGHVYLLNPNGILFGKDAQVSVHALTAATSAKASDDLARKGIDVSVTSAPGATIRNEGRISSGQGGFVYLVAPKVENGETGVIVSPGGEVLLAAGATVQLTDRPDGLGVAIEYTAPGVQGGEAVNVGRLVADGGLVKMRGELVTQGGHAQADSARLQNGKVELFAGSAFLGAKRVTLEATERITVTDFTQINLADPAVAGDGSSDEQTLALRSGGDVVFGQGARIVDDPDSVGANPSKTWNVEIVAGADLASSDPLALRAGSDGGLYLSGARYDAAGNRTGVESHGGEVALRGGSLTVRAAGDVVVGNEGGLETTTGDIDVDAGRDVSFLANRRDTDGVIESGSGDIRVVAGRSVMLRNGAAEGNAAIRTRGVLGTDAQGRTTRSSGGSIFIHAKTGDIDAGRGNRWVEPGSAWTQADYESFGYPMPDFDFLPVVREGILGIGTEAGGDVTLVAGRDVLTDAVATPSRSGGTASVLRVQTEGDLAGENTGTHYDGSHIGLFGKPVAYELDPFAGFERAFLLPEAPGSEPGRLTVVAGRDISGEFMVRGGDAVMRAGFAIVGDASSAQIRTNADAVITPSAHAEASPAAGWFGPLERPVTVDLVGASVDALAYNGIALRGIRNPSLVLPPSGDGGSHRVPSYGPQDTARLEAVRGDVVLVGNSGLDTQLQTDLDAQARILPPILQVKTNHFTRGSESRGGDLVLVNDFQIFPSASGELSVDVAGELRTANLVAATSAAVTLLVTSSGSAIDGKVRIKGDALLRDPVTGIEFRLGSPVTIDEALPPQPALGKVLVRGTQGATGVKIPQGTRLIALDGTRYEVSGDSEIPPASRRFSSGEVRFFAYAPSSTPLRIPPRTVLVASDGTRFETTAAADLLPGQTSVSVGVRAITAGHDAPARSLSLLSPVAGIRAVTNYVATARPAVATVEIRSVEAAAGNDARSRTIVRFVDPLPGVQRVFNSEDVGGSTDKASFGAAAAGNLAIATAQIKGPAGALATETRLVLVNQSDVLDPVSKDEVVIEVAGLAEAGGLTPSVFRTLQVDAAGHTRPDGPDGQIASVESAQVWQSESPRSSAELVQSDAAPYVETRNQQSGFDYALYYQLCKSGTTCRNDSVRDPRLSTSGALGKTAYITAGSGPTHAFDATPASVRAEAGLRRVGLELAESALVETFGDAIDFGLRVQHAVASAVTRIRVATGSFLVQSDAGAGARVAGPGSLSLEVGVVPFHEADVNADETISRSEFAAGAAPGDAGLWSQVFSELDAQGLLQIRDGLLRASDAPWIPTGKGGAISLPESGGAVLGIESIGNLANASLPESGARLEIAAARDVNLNARGAIGTLAGGAVGLRSVGGSIFGGFPEPWFSGKRGIYSLRAGPGNEARPALPSGGGRIDIDAFGEFDIEGSALASLSSGDVQIRSRTRSITAGQGRKFSKEAVALNPVTNLPEVTFAGSGIAVQPGGSLTLVAKRNLNIGAGITAARISIDAGGSVNAGSGALTSTGSISISAGGSITGSIKAGGNISVGSGTLGPGAKVSAGGLVAGAGSVASNSSGGKASAETAVSSGKDSGASTAATAGLRAGVGAAKSRPSGWKIDVSSRPCEDDRCA